MPKYLTRQSIDPTASIPVAHPRLAHYLDDDCSSKWNEDEAWKLDVGAECNRLLNLADELERLYVCHPEASKDIRSLVARVAEFEELEEE